MHGFIRGSGLLAASIVLGSCGSSWDIRKGEELPIGCDQSYFYADADDDGWGDPASTPEALCLADVKRGLTASNGRDCDDGDGQITGLVGTSCPDGLVGSLSGDAPPHGGVVFDQSEFAYVYGPEAPVVRHGAAVTACEGWGGAALEGEVWVDVGSLATFSSQAEFQAVKDALAGTAAAAGTYAAFVGIHWDGPSIDSGAWSWDDDSDDALIQSGIIGWCAGEPVPADFFPLLNPQDPDHVTAMIAQLDELRLAMVFRDGAWCLGLPSDAADADPRYTTSDAHLICKRPTPDPDDYRHRVDSGE